MGKALIVSGQMLDPTSVDRLVLFYRTGWISWHQVNLRFDPPDTWLAVIPAADLTPPEGTFDRGYLDYYIVAFHASSGRAFVYASPTTPTRVRLVPRKPDVDEELRSMAEPAKPRDAEDEHPEPTRRQPELTEKERAILQAEADAALPPDSTKADGTTSPPSDPQSLVRTPNKDLSFSLGAERIRQLGLRNLAEAVEIMPGLTTARDVQGFWRVTGRGRTSDAEIVVLLDGQRVNNPLDGKVDWELPLTDVERIEAHFAPDIPVEFGSAYALIQITSTRRDGVGGGGFIGAYGPPQEFANDSYGGHVLGGHTWGKFRFSGGADVAVRAGYLRTVAVDGIPRDGIAGQTDDERIGGVARLRFEYAINETAAVHLQLRASHEQRSTLVGAVDVLEPESKLVGQLGLIDAGGHGTVGNWLIEGHLFSDEQRTDRNLALFPAGAFVQPLSLPEGLFLRTIANVTSVGAAVATSTSFGPLDSLRFGADVQRQAITRFEEATTPANDSSLRYQLPGGAELPAQVPEWATRWIAGLHAENIWRPTRLLTLTTGLRADVATGLGEPLWLPSGRVALALRVAPFMLLRAAVSRATRLPTFDELLSVVPVPANLNRGLPSGFDPTALTRPVTLNAFEMGVDSVIGPPENRLVARLTGLFDLYEDPIEVIDEGQTFRLTNRPKGEQYLGAQGEVRYDFRKAVSVFANASWIVGQDRALIDSAPAFSYLNDVPSLRANGGLIIPIKRVLSLATTVTYGSARHSNTRSVIEVQRAWEIPPYLLLSATIRSEPIAGFLEIAASVYSVTLQGKSVDPVLRPDLLPGLLPREGLNGNFTVRAVY